MENYDGTNAIGSSYGAEYNFSSSGNGNVVSGIDINGINGNNFNMDNFNNAGNGNNYFTTQTTETTTTTTYNQSYNVPMEGSTFEGTQEVQYNI